MNAFAGPSPSSAADELERRVRELCAEACGRPAGELSLQRRFLEYGLDSVQALELVCAVEEAFGVAIEDELASRLKTLEELTLCVRRKLADAGGVGP